MSTATVSLREIAAQWRAARRIYPVYASIVRQFDLGLEPCRDLESPIDRNDPAILEKIAAWFDHVDAKSHAGHLRQALQTAHVAKEDNLRGLLDRFLGKEKRSAADRDKVDFLLVQYFAQCAPHSMHNRELDLDDIAQVLEPVLGETVPQQPRWLEVLDSELSKLKQCQTLHELLDKGILAHVRQLKDEAGDMYFGSAAMLAFTRFNFAARHAFFRLLHADLGAMRHALQELEKRGIKHLDCKAAGLSDKEPLENLAAICHDWKTPFRAPYAAGKPFEQMMKIVLLLEQEAAKPVPVPKPAPKPEAKAAPAAAEKPISKPEAQPAPAAAEKPVSKPQAKPAPIPPPAKKPEAAKAKAQPTASAADSTHEFSFEAADGAVPRELVEAAKQADAANGPSTTEIPVYSAEEQTTPAAAPRKTGLDLQACLEHIAEQLIGEVQPTPTSVATVYYNDTKILLSSWEVSAFTKGGNDAADALQRAVAARTILLESLERKKKGVPAADLPEALKVAHAEIALLQESIARSKERKDIDAAVNLAATCKRMLALIDEAEKPGR